MTRGSWGLLTPKHLAFILGLTIAGLTTNSKELEASIQQFVPSKSGWWLSHPSEKYESHLG